MATRISAVVPMYNAQMSIDRCLAPLLSMQKRGEIAEIIVVDDRSTDHSADVVRAHQGVRLLSMPAQGGPGAARNLGAAFATGTHFWFVDADVAAADNAARVLRATFERTGAAAVIGSYDDSPAAENFLSQYKNLVHHYYHHLGKPSGSTFWSGCGAVERNVFLKLGGFNAHQLSIEDIELGYRLRDAGGRIVLEASLQGKHLKEWRLANLMHTEIFVRALPWARLMLERRHITDDLNVGKLERARAVLVMAAIAGVIAWVFGWVDGRLTATLLVIVVGANVEMLTFFFQRRGMLFALRAFLFHQFYYLYGSVAFAVAAAGHYLRRIRKALRRVG